jgi:hypothetical protein
MQDVLGDASPEWAALRQGLWGRLTSATEGAAEMGPQKLANRLAEFLNGSGKPLADTMFSGRERLMMHQFLNLQQQLIPRPGTVNYSNTAPVLRMLAGNALKGITVALGADVAGPVGALAGYGANVAGKALVERSAAGRVARSLYQSPAQNGVNQRFANQMGRAASIGARGMGPLIGGAPAPLSMIGHDPRTDDRGVRATATPDEMTRARSPLHVATAGIPTAQRNPFQQRLLDAVLNRQRDQTPVEQTFGPMRIGGGL